MKPKTTRIGEFLHQNRLIRGILVGSAAFFIAFLADNFNFFRQLEWKSWDLRLNLLSDPSKASKDIVLFLIDQYSLDFYEKEQGLSWPWPRQMYSAVLQYCMAGGARACVFDLILTESSVYGVEDDHKMAETIAKAGNVFLTLSVSHEEREIEETSLRILNRFSSGIPGRKHKAIFSAQSVSLPVEALLNSARGMGNVQFSPDKDGIYRRLPLLFSYKNLLLPSLPLAVAEFVGKEQSEFLQGREVFFKGEKIPLDKSGQMLIHYYGPRGSYTSYSIASIINSWALLEEGKLPQIPPSEFAGKIVLVSSSASGLYDLRPTPFSPVCPGIEIQATVIDNLLRGDFIHLATRGFHLFLLLIFALITGMGVSYFQRLWKLSFFSIFCLVLPAGAACLAFLSGYWLDFVSPESAVILSFSAASLLNFSFEGRQRRFIKSVFRFYLSPQVIDRIIKNPSLLQLGGEKREISSFFSDIVGFSAIAEDLSPENLTDLLNSYLSEMTDIILAYQGTLDKYEGDAIIAFWNAPLDQSDHSLRACRAALECQKRLQELRPHFRAKFGHDLSARIGVNSGPAVVGNMGSHSRFDYTAIGDTVNLASRLEGACRQYNVPILIGEKTYTQVKEQIVAREIDIVRTLGKKNPERVFEIIGEKGEVSPSELESVSNFHLALAAYRKREWERASGLFRKEKNIILAQVYIDRCQAFKHSPPPRDWDGVFDLKFK